MSSITKRSQDLYAVHQQQIYRQTDRLFAILMSVQWIAGIVAALVISPRTWIGQTSEIHTHVYAAIFLGGAISIFPIGMAILQPGSLATRYSIAVGQMLMSSLLIHLSGGRIETHFHVFGSLAFLSFYRDWRVLVPATIVVALDHMFRGIYYPQSVFGILTPERWRWVEHAGWVMFEDIFLVIACVRGQAEMRQIAENTALLDASEVRYRSVTDSASEAIITLNTSGEMLFVNRSTERVFGYDSHELIGKKIIDFIPESERRRQSLLFRRFLASDSGAQVLEIPAVRKNGEHFITETSLTSYNADGREVVTAIVRDITDRKLAEESLKRTEEYRNLFKLANDSILIFEPATEIIWDVNDKACEEYGLDRENFIGRSLKELTKNVARGERYMAELVATGQTQSYESVNFRSNGEEVTFQINASVIEYEGRTAILTINRDITEKNRVKDELEKNLSLLSSTFEATADGILAVDLNNEIVAANAKFYEMWSLPLPAHGDRVHTKEVVEHILSMLADPTDLCSLMQRSYEQPDETSVSTLEMLDGRIIERYTHPQKLEGRTVGRVLSFRDITVRTRAEQALRESESRYRLLFDRNPYPMWVYDLETLQFLAVNDEALEQYGYSREEFTNLTIKDIRPIEDVPQLMEFIATAAKEQEVIRSVKHQRSDGTLLDVEVAAQTIVYGGRRARIGLVTDMTERKKADIALKESETRLRTLLNSMSEGLLQVDATDKILYTNNCICEMTGYTQDELIGTHWSRLMVDEAPEFVEMMNERRKQGLSDRYEIRIRKKSGEIIWVIVGGAPVTDPNGKVVGSMGVFTDITERKRAEEQLLHDAFHDGLTGLANRTLFMDHLGRAIERSQGRRSKPFAVLYLDFDRFKVVNDSLGHAEGDKLLQYIARRLENCTRGGDLVARLGGDEFVILLAELDNTDEAVAVAERIQADLKSPFEVSGREIFTSTSIGVTLSTSGHTSADDMLRDADIAMYFAKSRGKAQYQIFDQEMHTHASRRLQIETEMRTGFEAGEFKIYYQPIVSLAEGRLAGFEALLRWEHPRSGLVPPDEFIPIAEENGMIMRLGQMIVQESCRQLHEWQTEIPGASSLTVSVNLSSKEFLQLDLADRISATLSSTGLDPRSLKLEITESHIMENSELAVTILNQLRSAQIDMSLDDFGTGYSSLSYLHRLPVSYLKIDRSFVSRMVQSEENREIVNTIVRLAQNLKMRVIAEGIETEEQLLELTRLNCEFGQGYYFARPMRASDARKFICAGNLDLMIADVVSDHLELTM